MQAPRFQPQSILCGRSRVGPGDMYFYWPPLCDSDANTLHSGKMYYPCLAAEKWSLTFISPTPPSSFSSTQGYPVPTVGWVCTLQIFLFIYIQRYIGMCVLSGLLLVEISAYKMISAIFFSSNRWQRTLSLAQKQSNLNWGHLRMCDCPWLV